MLLLCNEAAARFARTKKAAGSGEGCDRKQREDEGIQTKPLGLEYMADRLDVDDPLRGFMVRTHDLPSSITEEKYFQKGSYL